MKDALNWYGFDSKNIYFKQHYKDSKYTIKLTKLWSKDKKSNSNQTYKQPPQCPDLNPIKHLWHSLKLKLTSFPTKAKRFQKLCQPRIEEQWANFTKKNCQEYIDSILVEINAVIKANGHTTQY